jgi:hypothetical protein
VIEKDPTTYGWLTYLWVFGLAAWGGIASYVSKVRSGQIEKFSIMELVGEMSISAFAGVMTFWLCELSGFPSLLTAALVGMAGHMGGRGIALIENTIKVRAGIRSGGSER